MVRDPVCGMEIDVEDARATAEFEGRTYYFCCDACRDRFLMNPQVYIHQTVI